MLADGVSEKEGDSVRTPVAAGESVSVTGDVGVCVGRADADDDGGDERVRDARVDGDTVVDDDRDRVAGAVDVPLCVTAATERVARALVHAVAVALTVGDADRDGVPVIVRDTDGDPEFVGDTSGDRLADALRDGETEFLTVALTLAVAVDQPVTVPAARVAEGDGDVISEIDADVVTLPDRLTDTVPLGESDALGLCEIVVDADAEPCARDADADVDEDTDGDDDAEEDADVLGDKRGDEDCEAVVDALTDTVSTYVIVPTGDPVGVRDEVAERDTEPVAERVRVSLGDTDADEKDDDVFDTRGVRERDLRADGEREVDAQKDAVAHDETDAVNDALPQLLTLADPLRDDRLDLDGHDDSDGNIDGDSDHEALGDASADFEGFLVCVGTPDSRGVLDVDTDADAESDDDELDDDEQLPVVDGVCVGDGVFVGETVRDGVSDGVTVRDGVTLGVFVRDVVLVRVPDFDDERVGDCVGDTVRDCDDVGDTLRDGVGLMETVVDVVGLIDALAP